MEALNFSEFLFEYNNSTRSKGITEEEFRILLERNCKDFNPRVHRFYRGIDVKQDNINLFKYIDPRRFTRESSTSVQNYYTLLIDNSPAWKSYPKRSKSVVCSTNFSIARTYSNDYTSSGKSGIYRVIPFDSAKIGICPTRDIWDSFSKTSEDRNLFPFGNLRDFSVHLENLFRVLGLVIGVKTYQQLLENFSSISPEYFFSKLPGTRKETQERFDTFQGNIMKYLEFVFDPKRTGFVLTTVKDYDPAEYYEISKHREIWTSGPCLMVKIKHPDGFFDKIENKDDLEF